MGTRNGVILAARRRDVKLIAAELIGAGQWPARKLRGYGWLDLAIAQAALRERRSFSNTPTPNILPIIRLDGSGTGKLPTKGWSLKVYSATFAERAISVPS